jgi:hypothetical protein
MGFPRSEPSFVAALGLHSTPGYFRMRMGRVSRRPIFCGWVIRAHPPFTITFLVRPIHPRGPVQLNDASNMHSLRSHGSQLAGVVTSDLQRTHIPARFPD